MKLQNDSFSCGVYAVMNAARCFGIILSKKKILKHSNTSYRNGTNEKGILNALQNNNLAGKPFTVYEFVAFDKLNKSLKNDNPVIIYLPKEEHWCTVIGRMNDKYVIYDSDNASWNKREHGVQILTKEELKKRWKAERSFYGIIVSKQG